MLTGVQTTGPRLHPLWFLAAFLSIFYTYQPTSSMPVSHACRLKTSITPNKLSCKDMSNLEYEGLILARSADTLTRRYCQDNCVISQRWSQDLMLCTLEIIRRTLGLFTIVWKSLECLWYDLEVTWGCVSGEGTPWYKVYRYVPKVQRKSFLQLAIRASWG